MDPPTQSTTLLAIPSYTLSTQGWYKLTLSVEHGSTIFLPYAQTAFLTERSDLCAWKRESAIASKIQVTDESKHVCRKTSSVLHISEQETCKWGLLEGDGSPLFSFMPTQTIPWPDNHGPFITTIYTYILKQNQIKEEITIQFKTHSVTVLKQ